MAARLSENVKSGQLDTVVTEKLVRHSDLQCVHEDLEERVPGGDGHVLGLSDPLGKVTVDQGSLQRGALLEDVVEGLLQNLSQGLVKQVNVLGISQLVLVYTRNLQHT